MPTSPGYSAGPLVIANCASLRLLWSLPSGKKASNVLHVINPTDSAINPALCDAILAGINADARTVAYADFLSDHTSLIGLAMRDLHVAHRTEFRDTVGGFVGTGVLDALPGEVAFCVSLKTDFSGPSGRGRVYLPGISIGGLSADGTATLGLAGAAVSFVQAISDAAFATGLPLGVAGRAHDAYTSPFTGNIVPAKVADVIPVVSIAAEDLVYDSQRRRK